MSKLWSTLLGCFSFCILTAQNNSDSLPGKPELVSSKEELAQLAALDKGSYKYSVEDYFKEPAQSGFKLSPDGRYISYKERLKDGKSPVFIRNTSTNVITKVIEETDQMIIDYFWTDNNHLIYLQDKDGNENEHIYSVDINSKATKNLTPFNGVKANIITLLKEHPGSIIAGLNIDNKEASEPYRINITTGELVKLYENKDTANPIGSFNFDKDGNLKAYTKQENGIENVLYYRISENKPFEKVIKTSWKDEFTILNFDYSTPNPHDAFIKTNLESNTAEIVLYDLSAKKILKHIFSNKSFDAGGISASKSKERNYEIDFCVYNGQKSHVVPVSKTYKELSANFKKQFGNIDFGLAGKTYNEDKYLLYASSDKIYGIYFLYDVATGIFKELINLMPQLAEKDMAETRPVQFKSRDGLTIYGYLTIPIKASASNKVPLIVNPHGGPYGIRDSWGFNRMAQLFASRHYATFQINYRGSGGYGKEFLMAGSKQIGRNMLNDLEDGVAYAKTLGLIKDDKIAIYGISYGGLATLGSLVKTPDLYRCGIDNVGVSNLFTFFKSFPPYWKPYMAQVYEQWYDENDPDEQKIMHDVSPALNIEKINKPLFVIQGANDPRVNINESDQIVEGLRKKGFDVPYMVKYNEGHFFGREENRIEAYKCILGFFAKHLNK